MENFATPYPVIFFDGEQEHDKGQVGIHSVFTFKRFKALISQKTGIPANQLSAVFVCRRTLRGTEKRQKLPINENTNFNIILNQHNPTKERDCHFLVSIKKSKKERKGSRKRGADSEIPDDDEYISSRGDPSPLDGRSKFNVAMEDGFTWEVASPYSPIDYSSSPTLSPLRSRRGQAHTNVSPLNGVVEAHTKIDRYSSLLKRQGVGPNSLTRSRTGWNVGDEGQQLEIVGASVAGIPDNSVSQSQAFQLDDPRKLDKRWIRESYITSQAEIGNGQLGLQASPYLAFSQMELFHPDRFSDGLPQRLGLPPGLRHNRTGALPAGILSFNRYPATAPPTSRSSISSMASAGYFGSRVPLGFSEGTGMASNEAHWQREHAYSYQLQQDRRFHSPVTLPHLPNVTRGLPGFSAIGNGAEEQKTCAVCSDCQKRNVIPAPFHWCVQDKITRGFRGPSPAGPIGPPAKRHIEAVA